MTISKPSNKRRDAWRSTDNQQRSTNYGIHWFSASYKCG